MRSALTKRAGTRFVLLFVCVWAALRIISLYVPEIGGRVDRLLAVAAGTSLRGLGFHASVSGCVVTIPSHALQIAEPCNGIEQLEMLVALVLAFPTGWKNRGRGLLWMVPAFAVVNLARICSLAAILSLAPDAFDFIHQYVWQIVLICVVLGMGAAWMLGDAKHALVTASR